MTKHILFVGDSGVGKTNIINRLIDKPFNRVFVPTITTTQHALPNNTDITLYDHPGQYKFRPVFPSGITHVVIVFDATSRVSYRAVEDWKELVRNFYQNTNIPITVIGNKRDRPDTKISTENMISAKIDTIFERIENSIQNSINYTVY